MGKFASAAAHLTAIKTELVEALASGDLNAWIIEEAVEEAFQVGRKTCTTSDWIRDPC